MRICFRTSYRDAIFPDLSGFPDFHISNNFNQKLKDLASYCGFNGENVASAIS